ncbi:chemotaxis protein CheB [Burkholderia multivorans]|uniref:chemotaxis protein CheB n=1 Tax=Burkholderia ubonensis TaxID=101571 RepID=UPI000F6B4C8E|nr:chemotaxis protein CheB [Burkholderia ubonensis]AYZ61864.1 chemotaxis protein CheB [Burkholderia multivorans]VWB56285.1 chemotaxis protein CheB [Burkholderia ubonensis]
MTHRDFIAIGASSGGVDALRVLASLLPGDLPATIAIVMHIGAHASCLPSLLCDSGPLRAEHAADGQTYRIGSIYVAPPDRHLIVEGAHFRLLNGAKENFARPAIDPLFRSAAAEMGARVIGVILTGMLDDGAAGLEAIQSCGGSTIVQDPDEAFAGEMPLHAARYADQVLSLDGLALRLIELTTGGALASATDEIARQRAVGCSLHKSEMASRALDEQVGRCGDNAARDRQGEAAKFLQSKRGEG